MFSMLTPLGHSASQAPVLVQLPNPSSSMAFTMFKTRVLASTCPCGNNASCDTLADTKSIADAFLHAATQAPQPMHAAAAKASSASGLGMGRLLASLALPVLTDTKPPAAMMLSKAVRSTTRSLMTGKACALHGSTTMVSPSLNLRMCN